MALQTEFERTFLARHMPTQIDGAHSEIIRDTYIPESIDHACIRLRRKGTVYELTKKVPVRGDDSTVMSEHTIPLDESEYKLFLTLSNKTVSKRRYNCTFYGKTGEVDVFLDGLDGLVLIDFEFENEDSMRAFQPPEVCLADVSQEAFVAGGKLAGKSYEDILYDLERYHYEPLFTDKREDT